jgi:ribA/ribD-fused uncharacterized protein
LSGVKETFGGLSNMAGGYPLRVNGHVVWTSEALFQVCHFPDHPDIQREILEPRSGMAARMKARKDGRRVMHTRADWFEVSLDVMNWCLRVKRAQNLEPFYWLLESTGEEPIVEQSRRDRFWGAVADADGVLRGQNHLGRMLMRLRDDARSRWQTGRDSLQVVEPLAIPNFKLLGQDIETVRPPGQQ